MSATQYLPSGKELLANLIAGKPTGAVVFFDNGTDQHVPVKVSDAEAIIDAMPGWELKPVIE